MKSTQAVVGAQQWNGATFGKAILERSGELRYRYPAHEDVSEVSYRASRADVRAMRESEVSESNEAA